ncbi:MAG TPA: glycosyltransferase [Solirubrobacteraceae bacterium]|nr:glycosyltransferase [Solirubrobacteraceae bacterium]
MARADVSFIAWSSVSGRSAEIARAVGGEARCFYALPGVSSKFVPLRWLLSGVRTVRYLLRRRPRAVIVTNPPIFAAAIALVYSRVTRSPLVLDSHPSAFGLKDDRVAAVMLPVHRWIARRADGVMVTAPELVEAVDDWGGRAAPVHEAPPPWDIAPAGPPRARPVVLFVGTFGSDEPVDEVAEAARRLPDVDFRLTGDLRKAPPGLRDAMPPNVTLVGFLPLDGYARELAEADLVLALTTERNSVVRAGYEAVYAGRPLVVSDWPVLRNVFPYAVHTGHRAEDLAAAVREALADHDRLRQAARPAEDLQRARWQRQEQILRDWLEASRSRGPHRKGATVNTTREPTTPERAR